MERVSRKGRRGEGIGWDMLIKGRFAASMGSKAVDFVATGGRCYSRRLEIHSKTALLFCSEMGLCPIPQSRDSSLDNPDYRWTRPLASPFASVSTSSSVTRL